MGEDCREGQGMEEGHREAGERKAGEREAGEREAGRHRAVAERKWGPLRGKVGQGRPL